MNQRIWDIKYKAETYFVIVSLQMLAYSGYMLICTVTLVPENFQALIYSSECTAFNMQWEPCGGPSTNGGGRITLAIQDVFLKSRGRG